MVRARTSSPQRGRASSPHRGTGLLPAAPPQRVCCARYRRRLGVSPRPQALIREIALLHAPALRCRARTRLTVPP
jgi:hypothetical protein